MERHWAKRPTIARNTSGFTRREVMDALKVGGTRPPASLLLDLTKSRRGYKGWCASYPGGWVIWRTNGTEYVADCHIRLRIAPDADHVTIHAKRGQRVVFSATRWQVLCVVLAHELDHWRQAHRDGKTRCLQVRADQAALKVVRKLGLTPQ